MTNRSNASRYCDAHGKRGERIANLKDKQGHICSQVTELDHAKVGVNMFK